jgi:hypothetical protein
MADIIPDVRASGRAAGAHGAPVSNRATVQQTPVTKPVP